jgi:hypothetical protein
MQIQQVAMIALGLATLTACFSNGAECGDGTEEVDGECRVVDGDSDGINLTGDHRSRCSTFCVPEGNNCDGSTTEADCTAECIALLDGFSDSCGSCILSESEPPDGRISCSSEDFGSFNECTDFCI